MKISLQNLGKRFNREWIFRHFNLQFEGTGSYAITGSNGSGKSTLLQIIAGALTHSEGTIHFNGEPPLHSQNQYQQIAIAAPYLELIEEMTASEFLQFHSNFKKLSHSTDEILAAVQLQNAAQKQIRYFSSGMKQRLKLAQAFFSVSSILLLDEPTTNLDRDGVAMYHQLIELHRADRMLIISSNVPEEYELCNEVIKMQDFK
jgi:ABC-type multidrug transport system ATPase subunit